MIAWLLACTAPDPGDSSVPPGAAFTGEITITDVYRTCYGADQSWRVYSRGVGELALELAWTPPDTGAEPIFEEHRIPLVDRDPAAWWALYELSLQWSSEDTVATSRVPCGLAEEAWTLRLSAEGKELDCEGAAC